LDVVEEKGQRSLIEPCQEGRQVLVWVAADQSSAPCRPGDGGRLNLVLLGKINLQRWDYFYNGTIKGESGMLACCQQWRVFRVKVSRCERCVYFRKECWIGESPLCEELI
ncbi:E3 ubiquitin-protein ligase, partial [Clarias magur]